MTAAERWAERSLGYRFRDAGLLGQALTHRSAGRSHNERLEFLGDALLGAVIASCLFERLPEAREGTLTRYRALLVRRDSLAELAAEIGLGEQLRMGGGELGSGGRQRRSTLADALEAVIGAVFLDGGFAAVERVLRRLYAGRLAALPPEAALRDAKTALQEALQARGLGLPEYRLLGSSGPPHAQRFEASCVIAELGIETTASGSSRQRAEQGAAALALAQLPDGSR